MAYLEKTCWGCKKKFWPNQAWQHSKCEKEPEEKPRASPETVYDDEELIFTKTPPKIFPPEPVVTVIKRGRGRPKTKTEEERKEYLRNYMRVYMARKRANIALGEKATKDKE